MDEKGEPKKLERELPAFDLVRAADLNERVLDFLRWKGIEGDRGEESILVAKLLNAIFPLISVKGASDRTEEALRVVYAISDVVSGIGMNAAWHIGKRKFVGHGWDRKE